MVTKTNRPGEIAGAVLLRGGITCTRGARPTEDTPPLHLSAGLAMVMYYQGGGMKILCLVFLLASAFFLVNIGVPQDSRSSLKSLVEAERAFARKSLDVGSRTAFMMYFADEAVVFRPHPVVYKEVMKNVPLPKNPLETTLDWEPIYADVSNGGDLGYTTGPSVWTDHTPAKRPQYFGFYFSFWKKQKNGEWKVVFDLGTELPGPYNGSRALRTPATQPPAEDVSTLDPQEQKASLMKAEESFSEIIRRGSADQALAAVLDREARMYRQKSYPIIGIDSIRAYFSEKPYLSAWEPTHCEVAMSGDLGYTYGSYSIEGSDEFQPEKGYFLHSWKRGTTGNWKLVAEIISPLPSEKPKTQ